MHGLSRALKSAYALISSVSFEVSSLDSKWALGLFLSFQRSKDAASCVEISPWWGLALIHHIDQLDCIACSIVRNAGGSDRDQLRYDQLKMSKILSGVKLRWLVAQLSYMLHHSVQCVGKFRRWASERIVLEML